MQLPFRSLFDTKKLLLIAIAGFLFVPAVPAQQPLKPTVTSIMAILTVKPGVVREDMMKVMPAEVRDTVQLYLAGRIQQWYARGDGKGVVFMMNCKTVEEAKGLLEALPLLKENFATFEYMPLGPLTPLRLLLAPPAK